MRIAPTIGELRILGMIIAALVSWSQWHSVLWAFIHGIFGWLYLLLWALGVTLKF